MSFFSDLFGGKDSAVEDMPKIPDFYTDPNYQSEQDFLQPYGIGLLNGNIPDYYKGIGMSDSPEFEAMLGLTNRDISQSAAEAAARSGRARGGNLPAVTSQLIADNTSKLRYADFLQSLEGKKFLMNQGVGISQGVRGAGQAQGQYRNAFNEWQYGARLGQFNYAQNRADEEAAGLGKAIGTVAGGVGGFFLGGPAGALTGAQLGSSFGSGGNGSGIDVSKLFGSPASGGSSSAGVSDIGAIKPMTSMTSDDLMKYYNLN